MILKTGRPARHPISPGHSIAATRSALARNALPREGVSFSEPRADIAADPEMARRLQGRHPRRVKTIASAKARPGTRASTTPGRLGARVHAPIRVAFRIRNGVGTRDNNLCEAQWLACAFPYRRFAAVLTDDRARLGADVVSYSFTVSDLHRLLVAGLPAHCERLWTLPSDPLSAR